MPEYTVAALIAAALVVVVDVRIWRTGLFRNPVYWTAIAICLFFMILVNGWLTKLSAPIVLYRPGGTSGIRPIWDILVEEYAYAFALLTIVIVVWELLGRRTRHAADRRTARSEVNA